jgi:hypothetical protein
VGVVVLGGIVLGDAVHYEALCQKSWNFASKGTLEV